LKDFSIKLKLDKSISDKIKFLCKEISTVEWSGVLFYTVEGSITDPKNMIIHCKEIFPMDRGTGGHTAYSYDETLVGFRMDNPETNVMKIGHIHSHNKMGVFFSGEDTSELTDNSQFHNYYLSVVVNNAFDIIGRVSFIGNGINTLTGRDEAGETYSRSITTSEEVMFFYECSVEKHDDIEVSDSFKQHVERIIEEDKKRIAAKPPIPIGGGSHQDWVNKMAQGAVAGNIRNHEPYKGVEQRVPRIYVDESVAFDKEDDNLADKFQGKVYSEAETLHLSKIEDFLIEVLLSYPGLQEEASVMNIKIIILDDAFSFLKGRIGKGTREAYFIFIMDNLPEIYEEFFTEELDEIDELELELFEQSEQSIVDDDQYENDLLIMVTQVEQLNAYYVNARTFYTLLLNTIQNIRDSKNGLGQTN